MRKGPPKKKEMLSLSPPNSQPPFPPSQCLSVALVLFLTLMQWNESSNTGEKKVINRKRGCGEGEKGEQEGRLESLYLLPVEDCLCSCMHAKSLQSCPTLCDPVDCSPPGSSVRGILQARRLEWVAMPSSRAVEESRLELLPFVALFGNPPPNTVQSPVCIHQDKCRSTGHLGAMSSQAMPMLLGSGDDAFQ